MKLYYHPRSPSCIPVLAVVQHLGIDVELQEVDLAGGEQRKPGFLRLNPNGKVPTLEDGHFLLWESNAIMQYLASKKPDQALWPADERARADISRWQFWRMGDWDRAGFTLIWENLIKKFVGAGPPDPAEVKRGEELFHKAAAILDAHLESREYLVGSAVTLADFSLAMPLAFAGPARIPAQSYPAVGRWYARLEKLDSWKRALPPAGG